MKTHCNTRNTTLAIFVIMYLVIMLLPDLNCDIIGQQNSQESFILRSASAGEISENSASGDSFAVTITKWTGGIRGWLLSLFIGMLLGFVFAASVVNESLGHYRGTEWHVIVLSCFLGLVAWLLIKYVIFTPINWFFSLFC